MWTLLTSRLDPRTISEVTTEAESLAETKEERHFVSAGKSFFYAGPSAHRLPLLRAIHYEIAREVPFERLFREPVIDHAYLLFKSARGPATVLHQDRLFWLQKEATPTLFTAWVSLCSINEENGALILNIDTKVAPSELSAFNRSGTLYEHVDCSYGGDHASLTINSSDADRLRFKMMPICAEAGQVIVFDGFEPHGSTDNQSGSSRLALKVVYGEGVGRNGYLLKVSDLENLDSATMTGQAAPSGY